MILPVADNEELRAGDLVTADESGRVRRARPAAQMYERATISIGGRVLDLPGVTSVQYSEQSDAPARGYGRTTGRVSQTVTLQGPAARQAMELLRSTIPGLVVDDYSVSVEYPGDRIERVSARVVPPPLDRRAADLFGLPRNPFSRAALTDGTVDIGEAMGLRLTAEVTTPDPPDGRALVTVRCERRPLRAGELRQIREALQQRGVAGIRVVVRDAAQLDGMRDRALAPLADPSPRSTADAMRARLARSMAGPKLPLP